MMLKGEDLLYSEASPKGKFYYIVDHPGEDLLWGMIHYMTPGLQCGFCISM